MYDKEISLKFKNSIKILVMWYKKHKVELHHIVLPLNYNGENITSL
jgi:hypothetical protein